MSFVSSPRAVRFGVHAVLGALASCFVGCQLIATVDRDLIPSATTSGVGGHGGSQTTAAGGHGGEAGQGGAAECTAANVDVVCGADTECASHDCVAGACSTAFAPVGTKCTKGGVACDGKGACVDMHCMDGVKDGNESDVDCGGSCAACANDKHCATDEDCASSRCDHQAGGSGGGASASSCKPCGASAECASARYCDVSTKSCVPDKNVGDACAASAECPMDACADGFCCDAPCDGACAACSVAKGAAKDGTCASNVIKNAADAGACDDTHGNCAGMAKCACDAAGTCKSKLGASCAMASDCGSGFCVDGVCCDVACDGACAACAVAKGADTDGTCKLAAVKSKADAGACDDTHGACSMTEKCACDPAGACKVATDGACSTDAQCASGMCSGMKCK